MTELSPQAQAVFDAFVREARPEPHHQRDALAAAFRAAAAVLRDAYASEEPMDGPDDFLDGIAAELETTTTDTP